MSMHLDTLKRLDEAWLDSDGRVRALPAAAFDVDPYDRFIWCAARARYGLPTLELVDRLRTMIGGRRAIEIGAGQGDLGRLLGIPMTDSAQQTAAEMRAYYQTLGHAITDPPADVERLTAAEAVEKHKPQVVVGSWITQLYLPGDEAAPRVGSSVYGVDEVALLDQVESYIHVGNTRSHGDKRVLPRAAATWTGLPWLVSRSLQQHNNMLTLWG